MKRFLSITTALALCLGMLPGTALALDGANDPMPLAGSVPYVDADGTTRQSPEDCTVLTAEMAGTELSGGWYVAQGDVNVGSNLFTFTEDAYLILSDGCNLTGTIYAKGNLTIYAQSGGSGSLTATKDEGNIALNSDKIITINGGRITATGSDCAAIGGANQKNGAVVINGGTVTASTSGSARCGAAIGGGAGGDGLVTINGGRVNATSSMNKLPQAGSSSGAAIGGGFNRSTVGIEGPGLSSGDGTVTITGGTVYASNQGTQMPAVGGRNSSVSVSGGFVAANNSKGTAFGGNPSFQNAIVSSNGAGNVYGSAELTENITIGTGGNLKSLHIPYGASLSGSGNLTISLNGSFTTENLTADMIQVPASANTSMTEEEIAASLTIQNPTVCGQTCTVTGWSGPVVEKKEGTNNVYTATYTLNSNKSVTVTKEFEIFFIQTEMVKYLDKSGTEQEVEAAVITGNHGGRTETLRDGGWYVVKDTAARKVISAGANSHIILADGCVLDAWMSVDSGKSLDVYAQSASSGRWTLLVKNSASGIHCKGNLTVYGGNLNSTRTIIDSSGSMNVNGGSVTVKNTSDTAGTITATIQNTGTLAHNGGTFTIEKNAYGSTFEGSGRYCTSILPENTALPAGTLADNGTNQSEAVKAQARPELLYTGQLFELVGWTLSTVNMVGNDTSKYEVTYKKDGSDVTVTLTMTLPQEAGVQTVSYLEADGTEKTAECTVLTGNLTGRLSGGWYVLKGEVIGNIDTPGDGKSVVNLILADGCHFKGQITVSKNFVEKDQLNIYAQSTGTNMGRITIPTTSIGFVTVSEISVSGNLVVNGGRITSGTIKNNSNSSTVINGGIVDTTFSNLSGTVTRNRGIIFEKGVGTVYGDVKLSGTHDIPAGHSLHIPAGASLSGCNLTGGGTYTTGNITEDMISVDVNALKPSEEDQSAAVAEKAAVTGTVEICGKAFAGDATGWTQRVTKVSDSEYTVTYSKDGTSVSKTVTLVDCAHQYAGYAHISGTTTHAQTCTLCGAQSVPQKCDFTQGACVCGAKLAVTLPDDLALTYNGKEQKPGVTVTVNGQTLAAANNYTVTYDNNIDAGDTAKVTVSGTSFTGIVTKTFSIKKAALTATGSGTANGTYGAKLSELTIEGLTVKLGEAAVSGVWNLVGDKIPNVGDIGPCEAAFTPATGADNYNLPLTAQVALNIAKAPAPATTPGTLHVQNKTAKTYTYNLEQLLPAPLEGMSLGTVSYALGAVNITAAGYYDSTTPASISGTTLTLPIQSVDTEALADIGTVTVTITSRNFEDMTATVTVKSVNKTAVDISGVALAGRAYNGSSLTYQQTAAASVDGNPVSVTGFVYDWSTPDGAAPVNAGSYTLTVSVDPEDPTYTGSKTIPVTIEQAEIRITAPSKTIYVGESAPTFSPSDCTVTGLVTGESLKTPPAVAYADTPDTSKTGSVTVTASGAAVPEGGNYKDQIVYVNGTLTVADKPAPPPVSVTGVSLDRRTLTLTIGESFSLTVTITPANADNKTVAWATGNPDVASVSGGTVTAAGVGTTTITVTTQSGGHTASCTVTVKAKQYTVTYNANGGDGTMSTGTATDGEAFTLPGCSFTPPEGKVFDTWAVGSIDGPQVKAGDSHTFTADTTLYVLWKDAPLVTYTVTYNANGGAGIMSSGIAPDQETFVLPECGFTAPVGKEFDCWAIGSPAGTRIKAGSSFTFTADTTVYAVWKDLPRDITGIVWQNGANVSGATVQLKQGANIIAQRVTGADGSFTFRDVPAGMYNLVVEKGGITVTVMQEITNSSANLTITLPNGNMNTEVVVKPDTPPVIAGGLDSIFQDEMVYTPEDKEIVAAGGTVEFKLVVEKQDTPPAAIQIEAVKPANQTIGLYLDLSITKTVTQNGGTETTTIVSQVGSLIQTIIPLPAELQGKSSYTVYREHDGVVEALPSSGNGERYEVSADKTSITIYASKYSTYAIAWSSSTPIDPGPVTPSRPSGGGGGSSVSSYRVTVEKMEHGKVVSNRTNASSGSTVTLTVTPDSGYLLDTLTVTDSWGNTVKLADKGSGRYTFTMPSRAVTVKATFVPVQTEWNNPYTDVTMGTWYYEAVRFVSENGLMGGYGGSLFGPNDNLSRGQLAQILYNHTGRPVIRTSSTFTDVDPDVWYSTAVSWAVSEGIVSGYGDGCFGPNDPVTREQLAVMLWRYAGSPAATEKELNFTDADRASGYALEALRWAVENDIINGKDSGFLAPQDRATRAQAAQTLMNFLGK